MKRPLEQVKPESNFIQVSFLKIESVIPALTSSAVLNRDSPLSIEVNGIWM